MSRESIILEPAVDRWAERSFLAERKPIEKISRAAFPGLSGGIMASSQKATANRIEGLLSKMTDSARAVRYSQDIDKNLDYLFTYLQLDMINMFAENCSGVEEEAEDFASL